MLTSVPGHYTRHIVPGPQLYRGAGSETVFRNGYRAGNVLPPGGRELPLSRRAAAAIW